MRDVKARAWCKEEQCYYAWEIILADGFEIYWFDEDFEFEWFTGLLDKNGVEIYEGDCLDWSGDTIVILWDNEQGMWCAMRADHEPLAGITPKVMTFKPVWRAHCEVIGNIHENASLLEK